jgi:phosphoribosylformylglycinamidine synthase
VDWEIDLRTDIALFSESQSRVLLSIVPEKVESVEASMWEKDVPCSRIGKVLFAGTSGATGTSGAGCFTISLNDTLVIQAELQTIRDLWQNAIEREMEQ